MNRSATWMMLPILALVAQAATASGFCDGAPAGGANVTTGSTCEQTRSTFLENDIDTTGPTSLDVVEPDFSDLDLRSNLLAPFSTLSFQLDTAGLGLLLQGSDDRVDVLELGIASGTPGYGNDRVLTLSVSRSASDKIPTWVLRTTWRAAPAEWSIAFSNDIAGVQVLQSQDLHFSGTKIHVEIESTDTRWSTIGLRARREPRDPNAADQLAQFLMPGAAKPNLPLRLRSGVLGGSLQRAGLTSAFVFYDPNFRRADN